MREVGKANSSSLTLLFEQTGYVPVCTICERIYSWSLKSNVDLKKSF